MIDHKTTMELDMGALWSIISNDVYNELWSEDQPTLNLSTVILQTYTGEKLQVLGEIKVLLKHNHQEEEFILLTSHKRYVWKRLVTESKATLGPN